MNYLLRSIFFVSVCTVGLTWLTYILYNREASHLILLLVFFSTLFIYSFHRFLKYYGKGGLIPKHASKSRKNTLLSISIASALVSLTLVMLSGMKATLFFLIIGAITLLYSVGFIGNKGKRKNLRSIPFLKLFVISLMWTLMTVSLPLLHEVLNEKYCLLFAERFIFVVGITIPFDIRDMDSDRKEGLVTIPGRIGIRRSKVLSKSLMVVFIMLAWVGIMVNLHDVYFGRSLIISGLISFFVIDSIHGDRSRNFYSFGVEGLSLLQFLLVYLVTFLK